MFDKQIVIWIKPSNFECVTCDFFFYPEHFLDRTRSCLKFSLKKGDICFKCLVSDVLNCKNFYMLNNLILQLDIPAKNIKEVSFQVWHQVDINLILCKYKTIFQDLYFLILLFSRTTLLFYNASIIKKTYEHLTAMKQLQIQSYVCCRYR